jgi:predicted DNA-binding protein with PD1-like motif
MEFKTSGDHVIARMFPGEDFILTLIDLCEKNDAKVAVVISSIGQLRGITLGYFRGKGDYHPQIFDDTFELISVSGIISAGPDGYTPHLHAVLGGRGKDVIGGHLISGTVVVTNETVIRLLDMDVGRSKNKDTGLMDLSVS